MVNSVELGEPKFNWYAAVPNNHPLEQGDFFNDFPIILPSVEVSETPSSGDLEITGSGSLANVILMTQSCDMQKLSENDPLIFCPRFNLTETKLGERDLNTPSGWGDLRSGRVINMHLIDKCAIKGHEFEYQVIDLRRVYSMPYSVVKALMGKQVTRLRLLPPYREHLAQAFARQFMRIGLPIDLPPKNPNLKEQG
jgi:hypothetical protein